MNGLENANGDRDRQTWDCGMRARREGCVKQKIILYCMYIFCILLFWAAAGAGKMGNGNMECNGTTTVGGH